MQETSHSSKRHIIFLGETGSGKSSIINLLLGVGDARVSNNARPCTQVTSSTCYESSLYGREYTLWDTRGLGEGRSFFQAVWGGGSEKDLKKFLKERHCAREIDLLVYCVHGSRTTKALVKIYDNFCTISRRLAAPVAIVVTGLEKEKNMEDWWGRNASALSQLKMDFDGHACITTFPGRHQAESKEKLVSLITRDYGWEPQPSGSYFGSPVRISAQSTQSHHKGRMILKIFKPRNRDGSTRLQRNDSGLSATVSSTKGSVYYSARDTAPPTPTVTPPTPLSAPMNIPPINTDCPICNNPSPSFSGGVSSMECSPYPISSNSSFSSHTSHPKSFIEENDEGLFLDFPGRQCTYAHIICFLSEVIIPDLTAMVRRRNNFATRSGTFGDVWVCDLLSGGSSRKVAVKAIKITLEESESHRKKLYKELRIWKGLDHINIVPLLGIVSDFGHLQSMVIPWFSNGSLSTYLKIHPSLDASERQRLLQDIAAGLCYLHNQGVIHGNLHSDNVLIDNGGAACITDFGFALFNEFVRFSFLAFTVCGGMLFADPARIKQVGDIFYPTPPCDVYSFGGLILHVLSGRKPYDEIRSTSVFLTIINGERPQIPNSLTLEHQTVIRSCWNHEEGERPSADRLARMLDE